MSSRCSALLLLAALVLSGCAGTADARLARAELRVCADPNNLPFSNAKGEGFENKIAELVAREMHAKLSYTWRPERRGFIRNTLGAGRCDVVIGIPAGDDMVLTTRPYYRSTYVFVSRADRRYALRSLDDSLLRRLRIGIHFAGGDNGTPPGQALARRHIVNNVVGYSIYGNYTRANPPARLIDAVANGDVDVAIAWGPLAGYFAQHEPVALRVVPIAPSSDPDDLPWAFEIAMGVAKSDTALRDALQRVLDRDRAQVQHILTAYGVPLVHDSASAVTE